MFSQASHVKNSTPALPTSVWQMEQYQTCAKGLCGGACD